MRPFAHRYRVHPTGIPTSCGIPGLSSTFHFLAWLLLGLSVAGHAADPAVKPPAVPTYTKHIAGIIQQQCSPCHRPTQSGPFNLLTFQDVAKRRKQILEVIESGFMPPWPPSTNGTPLVGQRFLSTDERRLLRQWIEGNCPEGDPKDLPPRPQWTDGWQLGPPDLVLRMDEPYRLQAEGKDVYRNFVLPIPITTRRFVEAIEFRPGNRSIHHAFLLLDRTRQSRRLDARDSEPGIPGMSPPASAQAPDGQFVSWQPGKTVTRGQPDTIFTLEPNTDLVIQMHLQPSGKTESIQSEVGIYFTQTPPSQHLSKIGLNSYAIDIPAGDASKVITDSYVVPTGMELLGVVPHAHYIGKRVRGIATLPNGSHQVFFEIPRWDFRWQGDYRFAKPVVLPKGSRVSMEWTYDNSTNNPFNPFTPPRRTTYGINTTNEMAELWIKVRTQSSTDLAILNDNLSSSGLERVIEFNSWRIQQDPRDAQGHSRLGQALLMDSKRSAEALQHLKVAIQLDPTLDEPHFALALTLQEQGDTATAKREFETALRLNPDHADAHGSLGLLLAELGDLKGAETHLRRALEINPSDTLAREALAELLQAISKKSKAP